jgi:hypothetical protein
MNDIGCCNMKIIMSTMFNQVIMRPLTKFANKFMQGNVKEKDILNLHHVISHIIHFVENRENVTFIFTDNDLTSMRKQIFDELLLTIFNIAKRAGETLNQPYSREIFNIIVDFLCDSLEVDENSTIHIDNISPENKKVF